MRAHTTELAALGTNSPCLTVHVLTWTHITRCFHAPLCGGNLLRKPPETEGMCYLACFSVWFQLFYPSLLFIPPRFQVARIVYVPCPVSGISYIDSYSVHLCEVVVVPIRILLLCFVCFSFMFSQLIHLWLCVVWVVHLSPIPCLAR